MTFLEKWKEDNPEYNNFSFGIGCPSDYEYESEYECTKQCKKCWNREIPNTNKSILTVNKGIELNIDKKITEFKQKVANPPSQETLDFIHENIEVLELEDSCEVSFTDDLLNQGYTKGINDCIEYIRKLFTITESTRKELFGCREIRYIIDGQDVQSIIAKLKAYEEAQKIEVGDVVVDLDGKERVVLFVDFKGVAQIYGSHGVTNINKEHLKKTGKHIDIQSILEQIGE
jgi:hypothetical protein